MTCVGVQGARLDPGYSSVSTAGSYETIPEVAMMAIIAVTVVIDFLLIWAGVQKFAMGTIERGISEIEGRNEAGA